MTAAYTTGWTPSYGATPTREQLQEILTLHRAWWGGEASGIRADLGGADLGGADLGGADLRGADLRDADLRGANLRGANLRGANLGGADLRDADLRDADLRGANLRGANLGDANLGDANLGDNTILSDGVVWKVYVEELVPALLQAGGRGLADVATPAVWNCHAWENCPMATAFGVHSISNVPPLYRAHANLFIQFFDGRVSPLDDLAALRARWNLPPIENATGEACDR